MRLLLKFIGFQKELNGQLVLPPNRENWTGSGQNFKNPIHLPTTPLMTQRRNSYLMPERTEIIDGEKYDIGSIMAFYKAGWSPSEIAKEKNYDEDVVRVIIEDHKA